MAAVAPGATWAGAAPVASPRVLRLVAFAALAWYGAAHWGGLVSPGAGGAMLGMVAAAAAAGAAMLAVPARIGPAARVAVPVALVVVLLALALVAAGAPVGVVVDPRDWDVLVSGLSEGISSTPGITVPYRGVDEWTRTAILAGGTALVALAAALAFWPRRDDGPGLHRSATVALVALYAVPVVQHGPDAPYLDGIVFCVLLTAFLWLETLRADRLPVAGACLLAATLLGALVAPRLDAGTPWVDYESLAEKLEPTKAATFNWNHSYGPLHWPRDGREILRIKARTAAYWKVEDLDTFDGVRWVDSGSVDPARLERAPRNERWTQTITVIDRGLRSTAFVGAGTTLAIPRGPHNVETGPGHFETIGHELAPGSSYEALVDAPKPSATQLRRAPDPRPDGLGGRYLDVSVPTSDGLTVTDPASGVELPAENVVLRFPAYGSDDPLQVLWRNALPLGAQDREAVVRATPYAPMIALAQRLRRESTGPADFVERVRARVMENATYDENVRGGGFPLERFMFDDRRGYCQHFSGAMALMLRMGGIPARVSTGFSPGVLDSKRKQYTVKDTDAHSWVEAWFEGLGWVTFDPTPSASPARAQQDDRAPHGADAGRPNNLPAVQSGDRPSFPGDRGAVRARAESDSFDWRLPAAGAVLVILLGLGSVRLVRAGRLPGGPLAPELAELQRALHRSGRTPAGGTTLARLESLLGDDGGAGGYLRAVRRQRFAGAGAPGPTRAERRALRRRLGDGLGLGGRVRAWWALPPRVRGSRR
jgi:transglutaminase-like putative cysteine protease